MELNKNAIIIQKWFRGCLFRLKRLPLIMYEIQNYLKNNNINLSNKTNDGRINSYIDENYIIDLLIEKFNNKIKKPNIRMWYDILAYDYLYGWIPINIKITTTLTCDNVGNLTMCVYSYTNEYFNILNEKSYDNGLMSKILVDKIKNKNFNKINKKDYYFIVINKTKNNDIIINSLKGLSVLTSNINNLPFQICWNKNRIYKYENINIKIKTFIECIQKSKPSWKESFIINMRNLK